MKRYIITEEQIAILRDLIITIDDSMTDQAWETLGSLPELPAPETGGMPSTVYVRYEHAKLGGTLRHWVVTTRPSEALGVYVLATAQPAPAPVETETCEWETIDLASYNPHYSPLHDSDIRYESVNIVRDWRVCPYCAKPLTIKSGRE